MTDKDTESETLSRRRVLRTTGTTAGVLAVGGVAASGTALAGRRGGRALVDGTIRDEPFEVERTGEEDLGASCMSGNSAEQRYVVYDVSYCPPDEVACTMYVHPDEAPVDSSRMYLFRSHKECKSATNEDGEPLQKASFGPSNKRC